MREFKFRVWDKKILAWLNTDNVAITRDGGIVEIYGYDWSFLEGEFIIQQFTGLTDKNGKPIYEGDIIRVFESHNFFEVKWGNVERTVAPYGDYWTKHEANKIEIPCFYFESLADKKAYFWITKNFIGGHGRDLTTVIGNIFDNPEFSLDINKKQGKTYT